MRQLNRMSAQNKFQTMRQDTSSLNFPSLHIPEEIDTFSEEFDSYNYQDVNQYAVRETDGLDALKL